MKTKRDKRTDKNDKTMIACYGCIWGHFAQKCPQSEKKVFTPSIYYTFVSSQSFVAFIDTPHLWVTDPGSLDHGAWDGDGFIEYQCVLARSRWLFMRNDSNESHRNRCFQAEFWMWVNLAPPWCPSRPTDLAQRPLHVNALKQAQA